MIQLFRPIGQAIANLAPFAPRSAGAGRIAIPPVSSFASRVAALFALQEVACQHPARLTAEQAAWVLNCQPHDVPVLVVARLLKPLGNPQPNSVKYFAAMEVLELAKDRTWLAKLTNAVSQHWKEKNLHKKSRSAVLTENGKSLQIGLAV